MSRGDALFEQGSMRLRELSEKAAGRGGLAGKLAQPLAEDAEFLRKLKPSLIKARARGGEPPDEPAPAPPRTAAGSEASHGHGSRANGSERNPLPLIGAALAAGIAVAKLLDWRGHAHPRT